MTGKSWPALEIACLRHRLHVLGDATESPPPLASAFERLLEIPEIAGLVQRAALLPEFRTDAETLELRGRFVEWLLIKSPELEPELVDRLAPILSEIAGTALTLRPAPPAFQNSTAVWRIGCHEVVVAGALPPPAKCAGPVPAAPPESIPTTRERREALIRSLDELTSKDKPARPPEAADHALSAIRAAAAALGIAIAPKFWTYSGTWDHSELAPAELRDAVKKFDTRHPSGRIIDVRQFGWGADGEPGRPAIAVVSLGPPMEDVAECIRLGMSTDRPDLELLRGVIRKWAIRMLDGSFADSLADFYSELHGELGWPWRASDEVGFTRFRDSLHEVLRIRCGLVPFYPSHRNEYPRHWMTLEGDRAPQTGRVRRVIQPGLLDAQQRLILPARVEVD